MKMFLKCTLSALAMSAVVVLALLSSGCNKNPENPSSDSIIGTWQIKFFEEEFGGDCSIEYTFKENGELTMNLSCDGEQYSLPMLWYTDGDKLYTLDADDKEIYEETGEEWDVVKYKVSGNTLCIDGEYGEEVSLSRIK